MSKRRGRALPRALFVLYALLMLYLLFGQRQARRGFPGYGGALRADLNLVPFHTIRQYAAFWARGAREGKTAYIRIAAVNLLGNIGMFVPLGLFLPALRERLRSFPRFLLCTAALIAAVEITQLFTLLGSCDIDDLILNVLGASVGFWIFRAVSVRSALRAGRAEKP